MYKYKFITKIINRIYCYTVFKSSIYIQILEGAFRKKNVAVTSTKKRTIHNYIHIFYIHILCVQK